MLGEIMGREFYIFEDEKIQQNIVTKYLRF